MNEHALKKKADGVLARLRERYRRRLWYLKVAGGGVPGRALQRVGVPDYLLIVDGHGGAAELKRPGEKPPAPTAKQAHELDWIADAGGFAWCLNDVDELERRVRLILEEGVVTPSDRVAGPARTGR